MSTAIHVRVDYEGDSQERTFTSLPISFGRGEECDLVLPYAFVSRRHGRIEAAGGSLAVVDEESLNGISCGGTIVAPKAPFALEPAGGEVVIDALRISVKTYEVTEPLRAPEAYESTDPLGAPCCADETRTSLYADQGIEPAALDRGCRAIDEELAARTDGELILDVDLDLSDFGGADVRQEIRALAEHHVPGACTLANPADAVEFLRRIDAVLTVALDALAELEISSRQGAEPSAGLSTAGAALRAELLDWTSPVDARARIGRLAAVTRQGYEGQLAGARSSWFEALNALSPASTERELHVPWWARPFRARALWDVHRARHARIVATYERAEWRAHCQRLTRPALATSSDQAPGFSLPAEAACT